MIRRIIGLIAWAAMLAVISYEYGYKPWRKRWQASEDEASRPLPGDDIVKDPEFDQTMAVTVDAPPSAIWPWLLQVGYGRGGWYSYDVIDMRGESADEIRPELQELRVGQVVPIAPNIGFRVEVLEPERALVLFGSGELIEEQQRAAAILEAGEKAEGLSPSLKMVGALSDANMTDFQMSWAFVLEPIEHGRTRLLERFRTRVTPGPATAVISPLIDIGHFLMTRRQLLGIKQRAERPITIEQILPAPVAEPAPVKTRKRRTPTPAPEEPVPVA
jgi:hypothetical protein